MTTFKIEKKNGEKEDFKRNKVIDGIIQAGVATQAAENITNRIEIWAKSIALEGTVRSLDIRVKLLSLLQEVDKEAATKFEAHKKVL